MSLLAEMTISFFILAGASFTLTGSLGLARLPDFFMRLHSPTKATTLGVGGTIIGSMIFFSSQAGPLSLHEMLIFLFLFITAPVSAHIVAKAALHKQLACQPRTRNIPWHKAHTKTCPAPQKVASHDKASSGSL